MTFTALTIKQPWATLMVTPRSKYPGRAYKSLEGRTWTTNHRGPVLIHTGQQKEAAALQAVRAQSQAFPQHFPMGVILGMAELMTCRRPNTKTEETLQNDCSALFGRIYHFGFGGEVLPPWMKEDQVWLWEFQNPVMFQEPISCKGKLRLWAPETSLHSQIQKQIELAQK